jgi:hypothetical protein
MKLVPVWLRRIFRRGHASRRTDQLPYVSPAERWLRGDDYRDNDKKNGEQK